MQEEPTTIAGEPVVGWTEDGLPVFRYGPERGSTAEQLAEFARGLEIMARLGVAEW